MPLLPESNKDMGLYVVLLFFFLIENLVGTTGYLQRLWMFLYETVDVTNTLLFKNLVHGYENTRFLYITETIVDGGAEELHGRTRSEEHV